MLYYKVNMHNNENREGAMCTGSRENCVADHIRRLRAQSPPGKSLEVEWGYGQYARKCSDTIYMDGRYYPYTCQAVAHWKWKDVPQSTTQSLLSTQQNEESQEHEGMSFAMKFALLMAATSGLDRR